MPQRGRDGAVPTPDPLAVTEAVPEATALAPRAVRAPRRDARAPGVPYRIAYGIRGVAPIRSRPGLWTRPDSPGHPSALSGYRTPVRLECAHSTADLRLAHLVPAAGRGA